MHPDLTDWQRHDVLPDGTHVFVRPLAPEDAALYPDFADDVSIEDARLRFFAPIRELSDERIAELTQIDYDRAMAFAAIEEATGKLLGVVRLHLDKDNAGGEFAVIVRSRIKGHGLGWLLMRRMIDYARAAGLKRVHGQVLAENTTMLQMCAELGFRITDDPEASYIKKVTLRFDQAPPS